ncbi:hypothetical protein Vafri_6170 [Volvox africanus]|uniref:Flavin-containing monooxygenase n=1 Tax=Volvox africanus TaxID=51714 RepID=A0A8J4AXN7_9CHLO|nr:hypothetical protein Vafri_6170 [Volvox africanus]
MPCSNGVRQRPDPGRTILLGNVSRNYKHYCSYIFLRSRSVHSPPLMKWAAPMAVAMPFVPAEPSPQQRKTVAIIGGGLSGLVAAKTAIQAGLFPTIFDRRRTVGGMWADGSTIYDSLHTNVSRFTCSFSDFPWPSSSPDFPSALEVGRYLSAYQRAFLTEANCRLQLGCEVLRVAPSYPDQQLPVSQPAVAISQSPPWNVEWRKAHEPAGIAALADKDDPVSGLLEDFELGPKNQRQAPNTPDSLHRLEAPYECTAGRAMGSQASAASRSCSDQFDFVVVATGFCAVPHLPDIPGLDTFRGLVLHSAAYRGAHLLSGRRRVAVIGGGHSAADIAADLAAAALRAAAVEARSPGWGGPVAAAACTAAPAAAAMTDVASGGALAEIDPGMEVFHVTPGPFWVIPRYLPIAAGNASCAAPPFVPLDVFFYRWSVRMASGLGPEEQTFPTGEDHAKSNAFFATLCGDQGKLLSPVLTVPRVTSDPIATAISDSYGPLVASGRLKLRRGRLTRVSDSSLELSDENAASVASAGNGSGSGSGNGSGNSPSQSLHDIDAIVLCTGLRPSLTFLSDGLLDKLSYTPYDNYVPLALHHRVLHPDAPGLAFVGLNRSPFFAVVELQGRLAAAAFTGALPAAEADLAAQRAGVAMELRVRQHTPRTPYPHQDYVGHADGLATAMGLLPAPGWRTEHDVVMAAHYAGAILAPEPPPPPAAALRGGLGPDADIAARAALTAAVATVDGQQHGDVAKAAAIAEVPTAAVVTVAVADAIRQALDDVKAAMGEYRLGRRVASAVFYALAGEWALRRRIVSRLPSSPSGEVTGRARFTTIADAHFAPAVGGAGGLSYLYDEQGQFTIQGGAVMRVRREYVYTYDSTADRIDVYFVDAGMRRGGFFHSLRFLPPEPPQNDDDDGGGGGGDGCWRAVGDHLCVRDTYDASYRFSFEGIQLREFEIEFQVKGPEKDYTATATYTRSLR